MQRIKEKGEDNRKEKIKKKKERKEQRKRGEKRRQEKIRETCEKKKASTVRKLKRIGDEKKEEKRK